MNQKFSYIKKLILLSPINFLVICFFLILEIGILSLSVLSLIPLADYILDQSLNSASRITELFVNFLDIWKVEPTFFSLSFFFVASQILKGLITVFINYSILKFKYDVLRKINKDTLELVLNSNWNFFSQIDYGYLTNTFVKEINNIGQTVGQLANVFASFTQFFIYLAVPFYINFKITFFVILLVILLVIPVLKFSGPLSYKFGKLNTQTSNFMMSAFSEILQSLKFILINSRSSFFKNDFIDKFNSHVNATLKTQVLATGVAAFFQPLGILAMIFVFGFFFSQGVILSEVAAIFYSLISVVSATNKLIGLNINIANLIPSYDQLNDILNKAKKFQKINGTLNFEGIQDSIKFKNIDFSYKNETKIIKSLNIEISKNTITSIVGKSGSGKSTLMDLLTGLIEQSNGEILVDDIDLRKININSFREKIGYVNQDTTLFNNTIFNNLIWVSPKHFSESEIWESLELANLKSFVEELPDGLETKIGERGVQLSGGQRQRLSLARAFLKKPQILILDEATSSLDSLSEDEIQKSIIRIQKNNNVTVIIIAHRLSTVKNSDKILVIDRGELLEQGTYESLKNNKNSNFNKMLINQLIT